MADSDEDPAKIRTRIDASGSTIIDGVEARNWIPAFAGMTS
jgi:hypothetical protein